MKLTEEWWFTSQSSARTHLIVGQNSATACGRVIHFDGKQDNGSSLRCSLCVTFQRRARSQDMNTPENAKRG